MIKNNIRESPPMQRQDESSCDTPNKGLHKTHQSSKASDVDAEDRTMEQIASLENQVEKQHALIVELWTLIDVLIKHTKSCPDLSVTAEAATSFLSRRGLTQKPTRETVLGDRAREKE